MGTYRGTGAPHMVAVLLRSVAVVFLDVGERGVFKFLLVGWCCRLRGGCAPGEKHRA